MSLPRPHPGRTGHRQGWLLLAMVCVAATGQPAAARTSSILERVLGSIELMDGPILNSVLVNIADNAAPDPVAVARGLQAGDRVIIGYGPDGQPIEATATLAGVAVTSEQQAAMAAGLAAGLYPRGSALYLIPPAGQLSLYQQDLHGARLDRAREFLMTRIDGSIQTVVNAVVLPDLAGISVVDPVLPAPASGRDLGATVLGAINAGEIATRLEVAFDPTAIATTVGLARAQVSNGAAQGVDRAVAGQAEALRVSATQLGSTPANAVLVMNAAANAMTVLGTVRTEISGTTLAIGATVTTVLGAVNGGAIRQVSP